MERLEQRYPQLTALQDAYRLTADGRTAVAEAYAAFREFHGPLITAIAAQMLPDLHRDAADGRRIVFLGRDGHSFAAATRALDPAFFDAQCHEVVLSRRVAEAALQDLEVHRGARFPEVEGFRETRSRVAAQDVPGAFRQLTAYLRNAGIPVGRPGSAVTLVDSSFKGTVQELLTAAYPRTDFEDRYAFFGAAPHDPHPHRKHGYLVHLPAEQTAEGRGAPHTDLHPDPANTFACKDPIYAIEDTLHGPMGTPLRMSSRGPAQLPQRQAPDPLRGLNPLLVPERFRDPVTREAVKAAALLAVHDAAADTAATTSPANRAARLIQQRDRAIQEVRRWAQRSPETNPLLKTVLDSIARRNDHRIIAQLQDHLAAEKVPEHAARHLWQEVENAPTRQARAALVDTLVQQPGTALTRQPADLSAEHRARLEERGREAPPPLAQHAERAASGDAEREQQRAQRRQQIEEAWQARPHSRLTERELAAELEHQRDRAERATQGQADAGRRLAALEPQVAAGRGPRVQALDARMSDLMRRAGLAAEHEQLERRYQAVRGEADAATMQAAGKDHDAERVTRWEAIRHPGRRDQLRAEAANLRAQAARAAATAAPLLDRMRELTTQAGGVHALRSAPSAARAAADHYQRDRQAAQAADQRDVDQLRRQVTSLATAANLAGTKAAELVTEQRLRTNMPIDQKAHELRLRSAWRTEQRERAAEHQPHQRHRGPGHERPLGRAEAGQQLDPDPGLSP